MLYWQCATPYHGGDHVASEADGVVVAARQDGGARGAAQRGRVEVAELEPVA